MVKKIRRKVKKIAMKASLVSMELEDLTEENKDHKKKLSDDFSDEFDFLEWKRKQAEQAEEPKLPPKPEKTDEDDDLEISKPEAPSEIKKLYRAIATKTHPDKVEDEYYNELFQTAAAAMEEENWMALVEIAGELQLDIDFLSDETCEIIEKSIERNEQQIGAIKNSFSFMWANQKTDKDREIFTLLFYKQFKINAEEFNTWLREHKGKSS